MSKTTFNENLSNFMDEVNSIIEPQDLLASKLNNLRTELQAKTNELHDLTVKDPNATENIEPVYDEIQKLKKKIAMVEMQAQAYPQEISRDLKSVLHRAYENDPENGLIKLAQDTRNIGIEEMDKIQQKIDELREFVLEIEKKLAANAEKIWDLEREKNDMAYELFDLDMSLPNVLRVHPKPDPSLSWSDTVPDIDEIGKYFETEIPRWAPVYGKGLGIK